MSCCILLLACSAAGCSEEPANDRLGTLAAGCRLRCSRCSRLLCRRMAHSLAGGAPQRQHAAPHLPCFRLWALGSLRQSLTQAQQRARYLPAPAAEAAAAAKLLEAKEQPEGRLLQFRSRRQQWLQVQLRQPPHHPRDGESATSLTRQQPCLSVAPRRPADGSLGATGSRTCQAPHASPLARLPPPQH